MRTRAAPPVSTAIAPIQVGAWCRPAGSARSPSTSERLRVALEQQQHARAALALLGDQVARRDAANGSATAAHSASCLVVEVVEEVDRPQVGGGRSRGVMRRPGTGG